MAKSDEVDLSWYPQASLEMVQDACRSYRTLNGEWPKAIRITQEQQDHTFSSYDDNGDKKPWLGYNDIPFKIVGGDNAVSTRRSDTLGN